eukprot:18326-Heterococcus_DN1.PRE.1
MTVLRFLSFIYAAALERVKQQYRYMSTTLYELLSSSYCLHYYLHAYITAKQGASIDLDHLKRLAKRKKFLGVVIALGL